MTLQFSGGIRDGMNNQITSAIGGSALLKWFTGSPPANCAAGASGTLLATLTCNATFAPGSSGGTLTLNAITGANASGTGTAGYFRIFDSGNTTCFMQGTIGQGSGDLSLDNTSIVSGQPCSVASWTITAPGA